MPARWAAAVVAAAGSVEQFDRTVGEFIDKDVRVAGSVAESLGAGLGVVGSLLGARTTIVRHG